MLNERLQILVTPEQRKRLEGEARRQGTSVAAIVRDAIDACVGGVTREDKLRAIERIRGARSGHFLSTDELDRVEAEEREAPLPPIRR